MSVVDATGTVVGFTRALAAAGLPVGSDRAQAMVGALDALDPTQRSQVYWAGRLTTCASPEDVARYDRAFTLFFAGQTPPGPTRRARAPVRQPTSTGGLADPGTAGEGDADGPVRPSAASEVEVLRGRDLATLSDADRALLHTLLARCRLIGELRSTRRRRPAARGSIDRPRTVRASLRRGGEPVRLHREARRLQPRRVVLLVDVSGSMGVYADALLRFAHAVARGRAAGRVEVFTIGTRLTRVTREIAASDPDAAMSAVAAAVPDWSGGTRLGVLLQEFLDRWGQRGLARGAVTVVLSDGWERGDPALLGAQMARLGRLAHRVVWANPRKAAPGYAPLAAGMAAALPHIDDFVEGHSLAALERLADVVAGVTRAARQDWSDA